MELTNDGKAPDWGDAGEIFKKSMKDALAHLDKVNEELSAEKEKAVDAQIAAQEELRRIQRDAETIADAAMEKRWKETEARIRFDILRDVGEKMIQAAHPSEHVKRWLDIDQEMIEKIWQYLKFDKLDGKGAKVSYASDGRSGTVYFNWDGAVISMYYEFGGGNTLATIDIPTVADWEKKTGFPLDKRDMILEFIAKAIIRDQASGHKYKIHDHYIQIYL